MGSACGRHCHVALKKQDALCVEAVAVFGCQYVQKMYSDRDISEQANVKVQLSLFTA
jgi:hypothetical protein